MKQPHTKQQKTFLIVASVVIVLGAFYFVFIHDGGGAPADVEVITDS